MDQTADIVKKFCALEPGNDNLPIGALPNVIRGISVPKHKIKKSIKLLPGANGPLRYPKEIGIL